MYKLHFMTPETILYIAMSDDGFIAGKSDNLDFLNDYQLDDEDYGYSEFIKSVAHIVIGRRTYEKVLNMGYPYHEDKEVYVITKSIRSSSKKLRFYNGHLITLIEQLKEKKTGNIYCDGGATLAQDLIELNLIDKIILSIIPLNLHEGTLLFPEGIVPSQFRKVEIKKFPSGLIQHTYLLR